MSSTATIREGWTSYDGFAGPELESSHWKPLDIGTGPRLEPNAVTTVGDGVLTVEIPEFTRCDAGNQMLDNTKHVLFTTQGFTLPDDDVAAFSVELRAEILGATDGDYRRGFASLNVADATGGTHSVFNILSTGGRVFAEQEILAVPGEGNPFTRIVEDPFFLSGAVDPADDGFRRCQIEIDRSRGCVTWKVDDRVLHEAAGLTGLPEEVHMALGIFTLLPVEAGESSCHGQGCRASWRNLEHSLGRPE